MSEREALLRAVCDNPDDDTPRLIFADWFDEHGEPERAEFIRVQIELATNPESKRSVYLQAREKQLLDRCREKWSQPLTAYRFENALQEPLVFQRGFVEELEVQPSTVIERGDSLFRLGPIQSIVLENDNPEQFEAIAECPHLLRVRRLFFGPPLDAGGDSQLALCSSPHLANVEALSLRGRDPFDVGIDMIEASSSNQSLKRLRKLDLCYNELGPAVVRTLNQAC